MAVSRILEVTATASSKSLTGRQTQVLLTQSTSHFLELPAELRVIIYDYITGGLQRVEDMCYKPRHPLDHHRCVEPPLMSTCKLIRTELIPVYSKQLVLVLREANTAADAARAGLEDCMAAPQRDLLAHLDHVMSLSGTLRMIKGFETAAARKSAQFKRETSRSTTTIFSLPTELRVCIYELALPDKPCISTYTHQIVHSADQDHIFDSISSHRESRCVEPPLMLTCHFIRNEIMGTYIKRLESLIVDAKELALDAARNQYDADSYPRSHTGASLVPARMLLRFKCLESAPTDARAVVKCMEKAVEAKKKKLSSAGQTARSNDG